MIPRAASRNRRRPAAAAGKGAVAAPTTAAATITGTKNRNSTWPWISSQPVAATSHRCAVRPAATDAQATRNARKVGTYTSGIQLEARISGFSGAGTAKLSAAAKPTITAAAATAAHADPTQLLATHATVATRALFSSKIAISCPFHTVGTRWVRS